MVHSWQYIYNTLSKRFYLNISVWSGAPIYLHINNCGTNWTLDAACRPLVLKPKVYFWDCSILESPTLNQSSAARSTPKLRPNAGSNFFDARHKVTKVTICNYFVAILLLQETKMGNIIQDCPILRLRVQYQAHLSDFGLDLLIFAISERTRSNNDKSAGSFHHNYLFIW